VTLEPRPLRVQAFDRRDRLGRRRWYFRVLATNGETIAASEAYTSAAARNDTVRLLTTSPLVPGTWGPVTEVPPFLCRWCGDDLSTRADPAASEAACLYAPGGPMRQTDTEAAG